MRSLRLEQALRFAAELVVLDQESARQAPLHLHAEQVHVLERIIANARVVVLKGRQVGISTVCCLYDLLFAILNPGVSVAIVADTHDKASGLLRKCAAWAASIGVPLKTSNTEKLELCNGSAIKALSAVSHAEEGQSRVGRSDSYGLIHCSELAFWRNDRAVFAALTSTALPDAKVVIESTASPAQNLFRVVWEDVEGSWEHIFLPVEGHAAYRADPASISDERWATMQAAYSFTRRDAAAWWDHRLNDYFMGDVHACMREFPVVPLHAFAFAEGRWILSYTKTTPRETGYWMHYQERDDVDEPVVIGVDTAKMIGKDASAIAIVGHKTGTLIASYKRNVGDIPAFIEEVRGICRVWKPAALVVESNGVGEASYHILKLEPYEVVNQHSSNINGEKEIRMRRVRAAIERGEVLCGPELEAEVLHSVRVKGGDWEGPDDLLNAISFALKWRSEYPWAAPRLFAPQRRDIFIPPARRVVGRSY